MARRALLPGRRASVLALADQRGKWQEHAVAIDQVNVRPEGRKRRCRPNANKPRLNYRPSGDYASHTLNLYGLLTPLIEGCLAC